jgi:hypothetical protein
MVATQGKPNAFATTSMQIGLTTQADLAEKLAKSVFDPNRGNRISK